MRSGYMQVYTVDAMRKMDQEAILTFHIPSILLMERAAYAVKSYMDTQNIKDQHILIVCGPGNNGGDGFALAVQLVQDGYAHVEIYCCCPLEQMSTDEAVFAKIAKAYAICWHTYRNINEIQVLLRRQDVLVDALFGTGLSRCIEGFYDALILEMNLTKCKKISIDIASGVHGDHGQLMNCAFQADVTISFEGYKCGQLLYPGSVYNHHVIVKSIGIPKCILASIPPILEVLDEPLVKHMLPLRHAHSHKGSYGKGLLVGGSMRMHGALTLAAKAALHSGIGTCTLFVPDCIATIMAMKLEESMLLGVPSEQGFFHPYAVDVLKRHISAFGLITIGNGMGRSEATLDLVKVVLQSDKPCILDGDALYVLGENCEYLQRDVDVILTPHIQEMSYLTGLSKEEIIKDPLHVAMTFAKRYPRVIVVLKDQHTIITDGTTTYMNIRGNHALAKGGSGDVLCGIITGLYAQSKHALHAAACGVYVHACCAEYAIENSDGNAVIANDCIQNLGKVYHNLRQ